jgi:hypothetical protein
MKFLPEFAKALCYGADIGNMKNEATNNAANAAERMVTMTTNILSTDCLGTVETFEGAMKVVARSWPKGTDVEAIVAGRVPASVAHLSRDGRPWVSAWHSGAESGEAVYVESYDATGRTFHGWVDAESRRIIQTG